MSTTQRWTGMTALAAIMTAGGCTDRLIVDLDGGGGSSGGEIETETDGLGETEDVPPGTMCDEPSDCGASQTCFEGVCVGAGMLRVTLSWTVVTDLDLHLFVPNGDWINFENKVTAYGQLDVDDCVSGSCASPNGTHVENIFLDAAAPRGTYGIQVINFDGRASADYSIEVAGAISDSVGGSLPAREFSQSVVYEVTW